MRQAIDVSSTSYHADPAPEPSLSASISKVLISQSPLHAWYAHPRLNQDYRQQEREEFDIGKAAHALLLEGEDIMVVVDADSWRTKAAKEARDAARAEGKSPVLAHKHTAIKEMASIAQQAIANCQDLHGYTLADGKAEQTLVWNSDGIYRRSRLDWRSNDGKLILDLKTTDTNASPEIFANQIARMNYDLQGAFYLDGNNEPDAKFVFLVQEVTAPYAVSFVGLSPSMLELGQMKYQEAVRIWKQCMESGKWPGYDSRIAWAEAPNWALDQWTMRGIEQ
jgi:hypothetical protein